MKFCVQLILVVSTTVQISCHGSQFIQMPLSWIDANQFCKDQNSSLACITPEDISNTNLQDGQKFWIPTHTTFSSWIKHAGYITQKPNGTEFVIPEDDIFTCQLQCSGYKLFIVNATKCLCFSDYSKTRLEGSVKVYESVDESELNVHFTLVYQMPCDYYICTEQFPEQFLIPDGVDNECFKADRFLVICSSSEINIQHQQRCRLLNTYLNQVRPRNVVCKLFLVEFIRDNAACGFNGNGIGQGCNVAFEAGYNFVKGVGLTSFINKDKPMISCYSGMISIYNDVQTMTFNDTMDCNFSSNFFCEKDVRKPGLCDLNPTSTNRDTAYTTTTGIAIGVSVSICVLVLVLVATFILIYRRSIKKRIFKQNQSNESSFRNSVYEANRSNNNDNINEPSINGEAKDYKKENEYATIQPDTKENGPNTEAGYQHLNKVIIPTPCHPTKQDSHYTVFRKSIKNNVYDELVNTHKQEKDSQSICKECRKKHGTKHRNCNRTPSSEICCVESVNGLLEIKKVNLNSEGNDYLKLEPEPGYSMAKASSFSSDSYTKHTNEEYECYEKALSLQNNEYKLQDSMNNYFLLENIDNGQMDQPDRDGEYVDSPENDYDHLHKKKQRRSKDNDQGNLYTHTCHDTKKENAYDTAGALLTRPCVNNTDYDTMKNVKKGINDT